jgi:hypothetical protein
LYSYLESKGSKAESSTEGKAWRVQQGQQDVATVQGLLHINSIIIKHLQEM